jgi:hypothetical protein
MKIYPLNNSLGVKIEKMKSLAENCVKNSKLNRQGAPYFSLHVHTVQKVESALSVGHGPHRIQRDANPRDNEVIFKPNVVTN